VSLRPVRPHQERGLSRSTAITRWLAHTNLFALKKHNGRSDTGLIAEVGMMLDGRLA
jgi:hypothetical protein